MRKKKNKNEIQELPREICEQILLNLPIKYIARFRCVSKPWSEILTNLKFLEKNFELIKNESKINRKTMVCNSDNLYSLEFEPCSGYLKKVTKMVHSFDVSEYDRFMGSCKGLICLTQIFRGEVYFWNPNTGQFNYKKDCFQPDEPDEECHWPYLLYGFGYNATKREFRLVSIYSTDEGAAPYQSHVHVYMLRDNSWRNIDYFRMPYVVTTHGGTLINDALHWPAYHLTNLKKYSNLVIAYNIYNNGKEFKEVELPDLESENWYICGVGVLNGLLTVFFDDRMDPTKFEAWIMLDYGRKESWRSLFKITTSISPGWEIMVPLYFMDNGTEILLSTSNGFYLYDSKNQDEPLLECAISNLPKGICGIYQSVTYLDKDVSPHEIL